MPKKYCYVLQPLLLVLFIFGILMLFYLHARSAILSAVGAGSLASSAYIVFGKPSNLTARFSHILTSYVVAICVGVFFRFVVEMQLLSHLHFFNEYRYYLDSVIAAVAVVFTLLITLKLHMDHPPAAGVTLVLVLDVQDYQTLIIILFSVIMLSFLSFALRRWMCDLF